MSFESWGQPKEKDSRLSHGKAFRREGLASWDLLWRRLSVKARSCFLDQVKCPAAPPTGKAQTPSTPIGEFPADVLKELLDAGFVKTQPGRFGSKVSGDAVALADGLFDFAHRMRTIRRLHLLDADRESKLYPYVDICFFGRQFIAMLRGVLAKGGIRIFPGIELTLQLHVSRHRWPGWAAETLKNSAIAKQIIDLLVKADGPMPMVDLCDKLEGKKADDVRASVDELIKHLGLMEDLHPETLDLMVGLLPAVQKDMRQAARPRIRSPLVVCEHPKEIGFHGGMIINDLRAILLEMSSELPRLRQDYSLFQKEIGRFAACLEPVADWVMRILSLDLERRVEQAMEWSKILGLTKSVSEGKLHQLIITSLGNKWLTGGIENQYDVVYKYFTAVAKTRSTKRQVPNFNEDNDDDFQDVYERFYRQESDDQRFLGSPLKVFRVKKGQPTPPYWTVRPEDQKALRKHLDDALATLKPGQFYTLKSVEEHLAFGEHNPLNLGSDITGVEVYWASRLIAPLPEEREDAGRRLIDAFMAERAIPLGLVQIADNDAGDICVARQPGFDTYFGRKPAKPIVDSAPEAATKVVVQPDFSVIVIGLDPAPAADLVAFCERTTLKGGQGALILKISRESIVKAVSQGLNPEEILKRLQRHASHDLPPNVLKEVKEWSNWVKKVTTTTLTVLRCPDRATGDRVLGALKNVGERISDTLVAIDSNKLTSIDRKKLLSQGIVVSGSLEAPTAKSKAKSKKRSW